MQRIKPIFDYNRDINNSMIISSMGRSGSTLLLKILNYKNNFREIFEPFFPDQVPVTKKFIYPQYLRSSEKQEDYLMPAKEIFSGKIRNKWTDKFNRKLFVKKRIVKDIRTNLLLKWIKVNFEQIPIILLIRNPMAVIHSWIREGFGDGLISRDILLSQDDLLEDFLQPYKDHYLKAETAFERLMFFWCIYYYIPLNQFNKNEIYISFYENLFLDSENEIKGVLKYFGISYDKSVYDILKKPSATTNRDSDVYNNGDFLNGWKKYTSNDQVKMAYKIMNLFGMENIYSTDSKPNLLEVYKLMETND